MIKHTRLHIIINLTRNEKQDQGIFFIICLFVCLSSDIERIYISSLFPFIAHCIGDKIHLEGKHHTPPHRHKCVRTRLTRHLRHILISATRTNIHMHKRIPTKSKEETNLKFMTFCHYPNCYFP